MATILATQTPGKTINEMPAGIFATLVKIKPTGALQARKQASGAVPCTGATALARSVSGWHRRV
jgi:hypothetical protein